MKYYDDMTGDIPSYNPNLEYSLDNGKTWAEYTAIHTNGVPSNLIVLEPNQEVKFRGINEYLYFNDNWTNFYSSGYVMASGDLTSLLNGLGGDVELADNAFSSLFQNCDKLLTAPNLPSTTLAYGCYDGMFSRCTSLVTAPELPATTLARNCYIGMFRECTSLVTAPELPATTLAKRCYDGMFYNCTSLNSVTVLYDNIDLFDSEYNEAEDIYSRIYTESWLLVTAGNGTFKWNGTDTITPRNGNTVPSGWTIESL